MGAACSSRSSTAQGTSDVGESPASRERAPPAQAGGRKPSAEASSPNTTPPH